MPPLRLALLGAGNVAGSYVRQIRRLREDGVSVELSAICSRSPEAARELSEKFGIAQHGQDMEALLRRTDIDALVVLTPMQDHAEHVRRALQAGKHVLCEKTLATTFREGQELAALAASRGLTLSAAPFTTLSPTFRDALSRIREGELGQVLSCRALYGWAGPDWADWFHRPGAGALRDLGVYALTTLTGLVGPAAAVFAAASTPRGAGSASESCLQLTLSFAAGGVGSVTTGFGLQKSRVSGIEIYGTGGTLMFGGQDWDPKSLEIWSNDQGCWQTFEAEEVWPWTDGVRDFCLAIATGRQPEQRINHALHVLDIIDRSLISLESGKMEPIASRFAPLAADRPRATAAARFNHNPLTLT